MGLCKRPFVSVILLIVTCHAIQLEVDNLRLAKFCSDELGSHPPAGLFHRN